VLRSGLSLDTITRYLMLACVYSFVVHFLLTHPESMSKLRSEVDRVIGDRIMTLDDIHKTPYLTGTTTLSSSCLRLMTPVAVIREAMRLYPPVAGRIVVPRENTTLCGGKHAVKAGKFLLVSTYVSQRDEKVWGDDVSGRWCTWKATGAHLDTLQASEFKPERMLGDKFDALPVSGFPVVRSCRPLTPVCSSRMHGETDF
jgi:cytochrome P450/NADPH-cytochrome P450 reductase